MVPVIIGVLKRIEQELRAGQDASTALATVRSELEEGYDAWYSGKTSSVLTSQLRDGNFKGSPRTPIRQMWPWRKLWS